MKIVYNSIIPVQGFIAINLFGTLFVRKEYSYKLQIPRYKEKILIHESIHTEQMKDFACFLPLCLQQYIGGIIFYIIYFFEWLWRVLFTKDRFSHKAYRNISFEQEAYKNETNLFYLDTRNHFEQWKIY